MLQVFYVVRLGVSGLDARHIRGPTDGGATVGARLGATGGRRDGAKCAHGAGEG
jgi:hypothetical protein